MFEFIIYVLSISFQLAGALVLVFESISVRREDVVRSFIKNSVTFLNSDTNKIEYNKEHFKEKYIETYRTKYSIFMIIIGYLASIFAETSFEDKNLYLVLVVIVTIILLLSVVLVSKNKGSKKAQEEITYQELLDLGLEPNLSTISKDEIDAMINGL